MLARSVRLVRLVRRSRRAACGAVLVGCVVCARTARAADLTGAVRLSLDGTLIGYNTLKTTSKPSDASASSGITVPESTDNRSTTTLGMFGGGFGMGVDYATSNDLLLGVRSQFGPNDLAFMPRLEIMFAGDSARPFLAVFVGVGSNSQTETDLQGEKTEVTATKYLAGASAGVHAFLTDNLSIDPMLTFDGFAGSGTTKTTLPNTSTANS